MTYNRDPFRGQWTVFLEEVGAKRKCVHFHPSQCVPSRCFFKNNSKLNLANYLQKKPKHLFPLAVAVWLSKIKDFKIPKWGQVSLAIQSLRFPVFNGQLFFVRWLDGGVFMGLMCPGKRLQSVPGFCLLSPGWRPWWRWRWGGTYRQIARRFQHLLENPEGFTFIIIIVMIIDVTKLVNEFCQ